MHSSRIMHVRGRTYTQGGTIADLAQKLRVPVDVLEKTIADYNEKLAGNPAGARKPLVKGPFHAFGPAKSWIVFSEGGLRIDCEFRVLGQHGLPIPGLYAAGSAGQGGVLLEGHGHHLGWAFTSGRLAGRNAALASPVQ
jgi:Predicted oxidoreductase